MAEEETEEQTEEVEEESGGGGKKKLIIIAAVLVVLGVAGFFLKTPIMNMISPPEEAVAEEAEEVENVDKSPALFAPLLPPLLVNIKDSAGSPHFMQISFEVMAREQEVVDVVKDHATLIRNSLILMLGSTDFDHVQTREGKEEMLAITLAEIQSVIKSETGATGIEAVYFTALIIQ